MPRFWGADSLAHLDSKIGIKSLADYVINVQYASGTHDQIVWWGRYFDHGMASGNDHWGGDSEAYALREAVRGYNNPTNGNSWILPIASPYPTPGPNSTFTTGMSDGAYVAGVIARHLSGVLHFPGSGNLMVYLDIENGQDVSVGYLQGWGNGIDSTQIGTTFAFPCVYINPDDTTDVTNVNSSRYYTQAWTTQPEPLCSGCDSPGPSWGPDNVSGLATNVWQYGESTAPCHNCRGETIYVDLDQTNPSISGAFGYGQCDNMLYINP